MNYNIPLNVEEILKKFFQKFHFIDKVVLFGSRARGDNLPKSDIDLCVYSSTMTSQEFNTLRYQLQELPILYKIDIVHFENSNEALEENIVKDGKVFIERHK